MTEGKMVPPMTAGPGTGLGAAAIPGGSPMTPVTPGQIPPRRRTISTGEIANIFTPFFCPNGRVKKFQFLKLHNGQIK